METKPSFRVFVSSSQRACESVADGRLPSKTEMGATTRIQFHHSCTFHPMNKKESRKRPSVGQTPTPLRMMEDPTLWHVMPSRSQRDKEKKLTTTPAKKQKIVLDEDQYVEMVGKVIERDYFPDLDKFRTHLEVRGIACPLWLVLEGFGKQRLRPRRTTEVPPSCHSERRAFQ